MSHPSGVPRGPHGTANEDSVDLSRADSRAVRRRSVRLLRELLVPVRGRFALTVALVLLSQAARVSGPLLIAFGIDHALPALREDSAGPALLLLTGGGYVLAALLASTMTAGYLTATARLSQAMLLDLRLRVFRHTQRLSLEFHENYTSGRIISRQTSDLEALRELLDSGISSLASGLIFMLFTAVSIFTLDWRTGLIVLVAGVPMLALSRWYQKRSQRAYRSSRVASSSLIVQFVETMTGIRAVQAFRREQHNARSFDALAEDYRQVTVRSINLNGIFQPGLALIGNVSVAAVLLAGGFRVLDGGLAVGALLALLLATKRFFAPVDQLAMFYNSFQSAQAALEKVSGLLEEVPSVAEPQHPLPLPAPAGRLVFDGVTFGYGAGPLILPGLDLVIPAGQRVAVVGATGAGKSTLAKLIARFYDVSSGSLTLDGVPLARLATPDLRRAVVMVTQEAFLFSGSVAENIGLGRPSASRDEIEAAAVAVGADAFIRALPEGYDSDVNKRGGRVSAGQRQLISFARAFLADPAVLILDEATSSLDMPSERAVQAALATLLGAGTDAAPRTALIIAHRLSTVAIADRVLVIHDGRIVEDGAPEQLIRDGGSFAALHSAWRDSLV